MPSHINLSRALVSLGLMHKILFSQSSKQRWILNKSHYVAPVTISSDTVRSTYCLRGGPNCLSWYLAANQRSCHTLIDLPSPTIQLRFSYQQISTNQDTPLQDRRGVCGGEDIIFRIVFTSEYFTKEAVWFLMQSPAYLIQQHSIEALKVSETNTPPIALGFTIFFMRPTPFCLNLNYYPTKTGSQLTRCAYTEKLANEKNLFDHPLDFCFIRSTTEENMSCF